MTRIAHCVRRTHWDANGMSRSKGIGCGPFRSPWVTRQRRHKWRGHRVFRQSRGLPPHSFA